MARETKAARLAREHEEARAADALFASTLHDRLMALFAKATKEGLELSVNQNEHGALVFVLDKRFMTGAEFTFNMTRDDEWRLGTAELAFEQLDADRERERVKAEKKKNALAKLTQEDRELLGL